MLTKEQEIELLINILQATEDDYQFASISTRILDLNSSIMHERSECDPKDRRQKTNNDDAELNG